MLRRDSLNQLTVANPVDDAMAIAVAGTNAEEGTEETDESDDVDDSRCSCGCEEEEDEEDSDWDRGLWDDCNDEELDENSEDGDSDLESTQQDVSETPLIKRAKTCHIVAASPSFSKDLSLLPTMPLDVLFEIFSHLSPLDIISLSRSSKAFHEILSSRNAPAIWKAVRKRFSAPEGPAWMSEEAWVDLLFRHNCKSCGQSDISDVDFLLLKRICVWCKKKHYVSFSEVEKRFPSFDFVVLLVPSTDVPPWGSPTSVHFYWEFDLNSMVNKLVALREDSDAQVLHRFMEERKRRLQCIRQNSSYWSTSYELILRNRAQEEKYIEKRRLKQIKERFKEVGYAEEDLTFLRPRKTCRGPGNIQLTDKIWSRIRPILEPGVKEEQAQRLEAIRCKKRQVLAACYKEFQRTLHPSQWKYLPTTLEIAAYEGFSQHIEAEVGVEVDGTTFDDAFLEFPRLYHAATEQRKTTLRALIAPREDGEMGNDSVDLATSVFKCVEVHYFPRPFTHLFGWDDIASHHCRPEREGVDRPCYHRRAVHSTLTYIPEIAVVVGKLAQLIGLDAATATAADFDEKDKRFSCEACPYIREHAQHLQTGYTWRTLVVHLETPKTHNPNLLITVLSDTAEDEVKQCERKDHKWDANQWSCSHCPQYLGNLQARQNIVVHLSESHGIQVPSDPTDLFFFERCRSDLAAKPRFSVPTTKVGNFRCLVCVSNTNRRFILQGVESHLKGKHNISSGQYGVDYAFV